MGKVKHLFIVNPNAGKGIASILSKKIKRLFKEIYKNFEDVSFEIIETKYRGHATIIAREYSKLGDYRIYAVGGDGTLNEVLCGMVGSHSTLACIPGGSGNDFIKSIVSDYKNENLIKQTLLGDEKRIDVGRINDRYFINVLSVGFDAKVNYSATKYKKNPFLTSKASYFLGIMDNLKNIGPTNINIELNGIKSNEDVFMLSICNGGIYGGGYKIAPNSKIDDGLLNVIKVKDISLIKILKYIPKIKNGTHIDKPEVEEIVTNQITISSPREILFNIDGESYFSNLAEIEIIPQGINMVFPKV